jgi:hypothetical protein
MAALPEIWTLIGTHLPPHHLYKLLCTSKTINEAVDNHGYWTRAFGQLIWRDFESMEIHPCGPCENDVMPRVPVDLYDIPRADGDYHRLMNRFYARMEEMREIYTKGAEAMVAEGNAVCLFGHNIWDPAVWKHVFTLPQNERNVFVFNVTAWQHNIAVKFDEHFVPQKEMTRRMILSLHEEEKSVRVAGTIFREYLAVLKASVKLNYRRRMYIYRRYKRILKDHKVPNIKHRMYWSRIRHEIDEE